METNLVIAGIKKRHRLDEDAEVKLKQVAAEVDSEIDPFAFTAKITTDSVDRDKEVLLPLGMDPSEFNVSGSVFWNHNYDRPIAIPGALKRSDKGWLAKANFLKRPKDFSGEFFPDFVRAFVTQSKELGKRVGISVGFIPIEQRQPSKRDKEMFGESVRNVISKWKLLEWSVAPVQSNADAFVTAVGKGLIPRGVAVKEFGIPAGVLPQTQMVNDPELLRSKAYVAFCDPKGFRNPAVSVRSASESELVRFEMARQSGKIYLTS